MRHGYIAASCKRSSNKYSINKNNNKNINYGDEYNDEEKIKRNLGEKKTILNNRFLCPRRQIRRKKSLIRMRCASLSTWDRRQGGTKVVFKTKCQTSHYCAVKYLIPATAETIINPFFSLLSSTIVSYRSQLS